MPLTRSASSGVDDDTYEMLCALLGLVGCKARTAATATEALNRIARTRFDLYLLDDRLPGGSGVELCREIREADPSTPVVFYSGPGGTRSGMRRWPRGRRPTQRSQPTRAAWWRPPGGGWDEGAAPQRARRRAARPSDLILMDRNRPEVDGRHPALSAIAVLGDSATAGGTRRLEALTESRRIFP